MKKTMFILSRQLFYVITLTLCLAVGASAQITQVDITGPTSSDFFGTSVTALPNGNIVVTDPFYDIPGGAANVGAVYLYDGSNGNLISTLTGSTADDYVGSGVTVLTNGNYVISSVSWDDGGTMNVGAVTFGNAATGVSGVVSAANSLIGSMAEDRVGIVEALANGNYIVRCNGLDIGTAGDAGAVTFGNGTTGVSGVVSAANSLVGSTANDYVGNLRPVKLSNGNYIVITSTWDNGATANVGAVTFVNGTTGVSGVISAANSLIGSTAFDSIGENGVTVLPNGNYVVGSPNWDNGGTVNVGAVTFGSGTTGITGVVSTANSLVGSTAEDYIGNGGITALSNGNYVVRSPNWDNGGTADVGAVTLGDGTNGLVGTVSIANSLVGSTANDNLGTGGLTALTNGNYVVSSPNWDSGGTADVGAVTFADGTTGLVGTVSTANSLVGSTADNIVGVGGVVALTNGNYIVRSPNWDNGGTLDVGAVTFGSGTTGITGVVSATNSLIGSTANDRVSSNGITVLTNGNYVVISPNWDNGGTADAGAVTFGNGATGVSGVISAANSLVGSTADDGIGSSEVKALTNGNYVVASPLWDNGGTANVGAATFGNGTNGVSGVVSAANSLIGSTTNDNVSSDGVTALTNGNYVVISSNWDNGGIQDVGAVTFGDGTNGINGPVTSVNSLIGTAADDTIGYDGVKALPNGAFAVFSPYYDNGPIQDAGAITFAMGNPSSFAPISDPDMDTRLLSAATKPLANNFSPVSLNNSIIGTTASGGGDLNISFDTTNNQLVVGRPNDNIVTLAKLAPTAASVTVSGRVLSSVKGRGVPNAIVNMTDQTGTHRTARTNQFGYYRFENVEVGETYIFNVFAKGRSFDMQIVNVSDSISNLDFIASQ